MSSRSFWAAAAAVAVLALGGCAHPINLSADTAAVVGSGSGPKVDRKVGLVMTDELRKREVISPGGGGDKLSYYPYKDLETGLYVALSETFTGVALVTGSADPKFKAEGLTLTVVPEIATTSFSPSLLTWPPTVFTVELTCTVRDADERVVKRLRVQGEGRAEFDEFKSELSLAAKRASTDAVRKLVKALAEAKPELR